MAGVEVSVRVWSAGVRRDQTVRRAARSVAWALAEWPGFGRNGCRATDAEIAAELGIAENTAKNSILQLRAHGHIDWTWRTVRGQLIRIIRPSLAPELPPEPPAVEVSAPIVSAAADLDFAAPEPAPLDPDPLEPAALEPVETGVDDTNSQCAPAQDSGPKRSPSRPVWMWRENRQLARARRLAEDLPEAGWNAPCSEVGCGSRSAFICADEGTAFCRPHRKLAKLPVPLAEFGIGPEA